MQGSLVQFEKIDKKPKKAKSKQVCKLVNRDKARKHKRNNR